MSPSITHRKYHNIDCYAAREEREREIHRRGKIKYILGIVDFYFKSLTTLKDLIVGNDRCMQIYSRNKSTDNNERLNESLNL